MSVIETPNLQESNHQPQVRPNNLTEFLKWCKDSVKEHFTPIAVFVSSSKGPLNHAEVLRVTTEPLDTRDFSVTNVDYGTDTMVIRMEVSPNGLTKLLELPSTFSCKGTILQRRTFLSRLFKVTVNGLTRSQIENEEAIRHLLHIIDHEQAPCLTARPKVAITNQTGTQLILVYHNKPRSFQGRRSLTGQLDRQRVKATLGSNMAPQVRPRDPTYAAVAAGQAQPKPKVNPKSPQPSTKQTNILNYIQTDNVQREDTNEPNPPQNTQETREESISSAEDPTHTTTNNTPNPAQTGESQNGLPKVLPSKRPSRAKRTT